MCNRNAKMLQCNNATMQQCNNAKIQQCEKVDFVVFSHCYIFATKKQRYDRCKAKTRHIFGVVLSPFICRIFACSLRQCENATMQRYDKVDFVVFSHCIIFALLWRKSENTTWHKSATILISVEC